MMLFKPEHVTPILAGTKTQTRRIWKKPRAKIGAIHLAKTKMISKEFFAKLEILGVHLERLGDISEEDAKAEGYPNNFLYFKAFQRINHITEDKFFGMLNDLVYVVHFKVVG